MFLQSLIGLTGLGPWGTFNASSRYIHQWSRISLQRKTSLLIGSPSLQKTAPFLPHSNRDMKYWHLQNFSLKSRAALFQQKLFKLLVSNLSGHLNYASPVAILRVEIDPGQFEHCTRCSLVACKSWLYPVASWNLKERARMWFIHNIRPMRKNQHKTKLSFKLGFLHIFDRIKIMRQRNIWWPFAIAAMRGVHPSLVRALRLEF